MPVAIVTGGSRGLGRALAGGLIARGWSVVIDGRHADDLAAAAAGLGPAAVAVAGNVTDPGHRRALVDAAAARGGLDLLVNNASVLGPSPQPRLDAYPLEEWRRVYEVNVVAPLALVQEALALMGRSARPRIVNVTSDAGVEAYEGWGGYGSSKAALEHLSAVLAAEHAEVTVWVVDPGDMRTRMHQEAFPGEDISDRPLPEAVVPALLALVEGSLASGRYRASDLAPAGAAS